jgi:hypothetical protein
MAASKRLVALPTKNKYTRQNISLSSKNLICFHFFWLIILRSLCDKTPALPPGFLLQWGERWEVRLWTMNYELWTMNYELWTMNYEGGSSRGDPRSALGASAHARIIPRKRTFYYICTLENIVKFANNNQHRLTIKRTSKCRVSLSYLIDLSLCAVSGTTF